MGKRVKVYGGGEVAIPANLRKEQGIKDGDTVVADVKDGGLRIRSNEAIVREIQAIVRKYVPEGVSLVDELIAERRAEAARE